MVGSALPPCRLARGLLGAVVAAVLLQVGAAPARAELVLVKDNRSVAGSVPSAPFADFDVDYDNGASLGHESASQHSSVSDTLFSVTGHADGDPSAYGQSSVFDVIFSVSELTRIQLDGSLQRAPGSFSSSSVRLLGASGVVIDERVALQTDPSSGAIVSDETDLDFDLILDLDPGQYRLLAIADGTPGGPTGTEAASAAMSFTLQVVPEPGASCLLLAGLVLLGRRALRRPATPARA